MILLAIHRVCVPWIEYKTCDGSVIYAGYVIALRNGVVRVEAIIRARFLSMMSGDMRAISANERRCYINKFPLRRYICNVFSHLMAPFSHDMNQ